MLTVVVSECWPGCCTETEIVADLLSSGGVAAMVGESATDGLACNCSK